jgi:hypothetical protein
MLGPEPFEAHREAAAIERMELHESCPGFVEQDVFAQMADTFQDRLGMVDRAVVGADLQHRHAERPLALPRVRILDHLVGLDLLADAGFVEGGEIDGPDHAIGVALGFQIDRHAARHHQRAVMVGFVVVAVEQHEVILGDQRGQHDLVRSRSAVEHEIGALGAENARGLALCFECGAFVDQQVAEFQDRIVEIVAEHRLAQMLDEDAPDRAAAIEHAAIMAGAGP